MNISKKNPIKDNHLRQPGQSARNKINSIVYDEIYFYLSIICFLLYFTFYELLRYYKNFPPSPIFTTAISIIILVFLIRKIFHKLTLVNRLKQGFKGEIDVAQEIDNLREKGYKIYHDILADDFNLDHVIVSKKGVFVIETKTYSKPIKGNQDILFDGKKINIAGLGIQTQPLIQVKSASNWLKNTILQSTGKIFFIKPVLVFPGWYVKISNHCKISDIWVLNPKAIGLYIERMPDIISNEDFLLISYHLSRYIVSSNNQFTNNKIDLKDNPFCGSKPYLKYFNLNKNFYKYFAFGIFIICIVVLVILNPNLSPFLKHYNDVPKNTPKQGSVPQRNLDEPYSTPAPMALERKYSQSDKNYWFIIKLKSGEAIITQDTVITKNTILVQGIDGQERRIDKSEVLNFERTKI